MTFDVRTPDVRTLASAVAVGGVSGLLVGAAYLVGGLAHGALFPTAAATSNAVLQSTPLIRPALRLQANLANAPEAAASAKARIALILRDRFRVAFRLKPATLVATAAPPFPQNLISAHGRDAQCLAQAVYYEARGEPASGQQAVAQVVLNRVRHPAFPKTICGVVFQRARGDCQFSFACNGAMHDAVDRSAWQRAVTVAERAIGGTVMAQVGDATQFQAARSSGWAAGLLRVAQVGAHVFYRFVGHGRASLNGRPEPSAPEADAQLAIATPDPRGIEAAAAPPSLPPVLGAQAASTFRVSAPGKALSVGEAADPASNAPSPALKAPEPIAGKPVAVAATQP